MKSIHKKIIRDLLKRPWRLLGVGLTLAGGTAFFTGIDMAMETMPHTLGKFYGKTGFADLEVMLLPEDAQNLPDFGSIHGVAAFERRLILPSIILKDTGSHLTGLMVLTDNPHPAVDAFQLNAGNAFHGGGTSVVAERNLVKYHGYQVGQVIRSKVGEKVYTDTITGIATSPEFFSSASNPDYALPEKGTLGVVFGGLDRIHSALGFTLVNDLAFRLDPGANFDEVKGQILDKLGGASIERITKLEDHFSHQNVMLRVRNYKIFTAAIIGTLLALACIVSLLTFNRLVLEQRSELGALLAMGYSPRTLVAAYAWAGVAIGSVAGLLSIPISIFLRNTFTASFMKANGLAFVDNYSSPSIFAFAMAASVVLAVATVILPVLLMVRKSPMQVLKGEVGDAAPVGWALRALGSLGNWLPVPYLYGLRNLLRRAGGTVLTATVMGFALGVPISYAVSLTSNVMTMISSFNQEKWDLAVDYLHPIFEEDLDSLKALSGVRQVVPYFRHFGEVGKVGATAGAGKFVDTRILGIPPANPLRPTQVVEGRDLGQDEGEIVLSRDVAKDIGCAIGDQVDMRISQVLYPFKVVGITSDIFTRQVVLNYRAAQRISQFDGKATGAYVLGGASNLERIEEMHDVARVSDKDKMLAMLKERWKGSMGIVYVTTVFSLLMAIIFIFMTINLNILEKRGEFATLLSFGYRKLEALKIMFTETGVQLSLAIILSLPLGVALALYFNHKMSEAWFENHFHSKPSDYWIPLAAAAAVVPWVVLMSARNIFRFGIASELRSRNIG